MVYYALTDGSGNFTIANLTSVSGYGSVFARSLLLALVATVICLVIALIFFTANSIFSTLLTGMANWDTSHFG